MENTCVKFSVLHTSSFMKKNSNKVLFSVKFGKSLEESSFMKHLQWLILKSAMSTSIGVVLMSIVSVEIMQHKPVFPCQLWICICQLTSGLNHRFFWRALLKFYVTHFKSMIQFVLTFPASCIFKKLY